MLILMVFQIVLAYFDFYCLHSSINIHYGCMILLNEIWKLFLIGFDWHFFIFSFSSEIIADIMDYMAINGGIYCVLGAVVRPDAPNRLQSPCGYIDMLRAIACS